jgi:hypothetical protein
VDGARMESRPMDGFRDNGFEPSGSVTRSLGLVSLNVQRYSHKHKG